jgi:hypothetical protein
MVEEIIPEYVKDASDCTIKQFMRAAFESKFKVLIISGEPTEKQLKDAFEYIYAQYVDLSGLYLSQEFEIVAYISSLDHRIQTMKRFVELQKTFIGHFDMPFLPGLKIAERYGHKLYWDPNNPDVFMSKLNAIAGKEAKYSIRVTEKVNELIALRKKKVTKEHSILENRKDFITMLNRLQQQKFVINKSETTVEELALMIKDHRDQVETDNINRKYKK